MASIRRYGPSSVRSEISPQPDLGRASVDAFKVFEDGFSAVNEFLRPAVVEEQQQRGAAEANAALDGGGPDFAIAPRGDAAPAPESAPPVGPDGQPGPGPAAGRRAPAGKRPAASGWDWRRSATAIRSVESDGSGDYAAVGPVTDNGDRAYGAYQVMGANIPSWTKKHYGKSLTPEEFLANPAAQDRVFRGEFGASVAKYGNEQDAASVWFTGRPLAEAGGSVSDGYTTNSQYQERFTAALNGTAPGGGIADYELQTINGRSFEPRKPFTVRDAAFNAAADRVIEARVDYAIDQGMAIAQAKADGDLGVLSKEMDKLRSQVLGAIPSELAGMQTDVIAKFERGRAVAERQAIDLAERRVVARQTEAATTTLSGVQAEVERLALTGGTSADVSAALAQGQERLSRYGPREGFTVNGTTYGPDPKRAGLLSPAEIAVELGKIGGDAQTILIQSEFMRSAAPGQFVDEFRKQVFAGKSPLPPGESLRLLGQLEAQARTTESARRTAADAERKRLSTEATDTINNYVAMTEQGVPVAVPPAERARILASLAPYPEDQRKAEVEFAVADAAVATHGMRGPELLAYVDQVRGDIAASADRGELDLEGVAVLQSLEDRVKKLTDAVTAEQIGLPMIEQLALDGARGDDIDWEGLRLQAAGKPEILDRISVTEAMYRDIERLDGMTATERTAALAELKASRADLARAGKLSGSGAALQGQVLDRLAEWSGQLSSLASSDAIAFAKATGIALPPLDPAGTLQDAAGVIVERTGLIGPKAAGEGVKTPVALSPADIEAISGAFAVAPRSEQAAFLGQVSALGQDQAMAIFAKIGTGDAGLFAAGVVHAGGNTDAARTILRGVGDVKVAIETGAQETAREGAIGPLTPFLSEASIVQLDAVALAYARGKAVSEGLREVTEDDMAEGYRIATGGQADGTGGMQVTRYGATVLPKGYTADRMDAEIASLDDRALRFLVPGGVYDTDGQPMSADDFRRTIEGLRPTDDPNVFVPLDADGARFVDARGMPVSIDVRKIPRMVAASKAAANVGDPGVVRELRALEKNRDRIEAAIEKERAAGGDTSYLEGELAKTLDQIAERK